MPSFSNASILVVDDSSTMRTILRGMLAQIGFRSIEEADSGEAALALLKGRSFSLVISDWNMGGMSGLDLLREFRRLRVPGTSRFIFATSERSWGHQTSAKIDGADGFITKPFNIEALKAKVETALAR
jgi:two-component system chemotaxis response regulator CheY